MGALEPGAAAGNARRFDAELGRYRTASLPQRHPRGVYPGEARARDDEGCKGRRQGWKATFTGTADLAVVPSPSWPYSVAPAVGDACWGYTAGWRRRAARRSIQRWSLGGFMGAA